MGPLGLHWAEGRASVDITKDGARLRIRGDPVPGPDVEELGGRLTGAESAWTDGSVPDFDVVSRGMRYRVRVDQVPEIRHRTKVEGVKQEIKTERET